MMAQNRTTRSHIALPDEDDPFGLWEEAPITAPEAGLSFGVGTPAMQVESVQRIQLPESPDRARALLETKRQALERGVTKLGEAQGRMERLVETHRRQTQWGDERVSFAAPTKFSGPEAELWATLNAAQAMPSFSVEQEDTEQRDNRREWQTFVKRVRHTVSHPTRVETQVGKELVGYTAVGWTGDFDTRWQSNVTLRSRELHVQTLQLVLAKHAARLRLLVVVSTGAARLALQLTGPGTQVLALPAAWKFVRDVLKELREIK